MTDPCGNGWDSFQRGWVGVICVASGGRVLSVALPNTEIRGVLLPFFGRLHEMVYLNLKDNRNVGGDVGVDLENLVELRSLMLRGTEVEGALPSLQHLGGGPPQRKHAVLAAVVYVVAPVVGVWPGNRLALAR